jgi:hypothetical protein
MCCSRLIAICLFTLAVIAAAGAGSDADALAQFGMLGHLAVDCNAPPSIKNPHQVFAVSPDGKGSRTMRINAKGDGTFPIWNVELIGADSLQYEETSNGFTFKIIVRKIQGRFRSWQSVASDGKVFIKDGLLGNGTFSASFESCGGST